MATDQEIRDAGFKYVPQQKYLLNPFVLPTTDDDDGGGGSGSGGGGIPYTNSGDSFNPYNINMNNIRQDYNAFPSRQAGEIYSKTFNPGPNPYLTNMSDELGSLPRAQSQYNLANQNISLTGPMTPERRAEIMRDANNIIEDNRMRYATEGQYIDPYDSRYSSMTEAQKFMDNYPDYYGVPSGVPEPGIPGAIKSYMQNSLLGKGFGMAKDFLGRVMPINERAIMENEARGAGIFTDDIGRIVTDDYNTAGGIMAGYNLNKIDADSFQKRRDTINEKMSDRINPETGKTFKQERLDLLDQSEEDILGARKKTRQVYKMREDKKAKDKQKRKDDNTGTATGTTGTSGTADGNDNNSNNVQNITSTNEQNYQNAAYDRPSSAPQYNRQDDNRESRRGGNQNQGGGASYSSSASTGAKDGFKYGLADGGRAGYFFGGRVNFKNGGLASIL